MAPNIVVRTNIRGTTWEVDTETATNFVGDGSLFYLGCNGASPEDAMEGAVMQQTGQDGAIVSTWADTPHGII